MKMENLISLNTFLIENQILTDNYRKCMQKSDENFDHKLLQKK